MAGMGTRDKALMQLVLGRCEVSNSFTVLLVPLLVDLLGAFCGCLDRSAGC